MKTAVVVFISLAALSCGNKGTGPKLVEGNFAAAYTGDAHVPLLIASKQERMWVAALAEDGVLSGAVLGEGSDAKIVITCDDVNLPRYLSLDGYTFVFGRYRDEFVDVALVTPTGDIKYVRDYNIGAMQEYEQLRTLARPAAANRSMGVWRDAKTTLLMTKTAVCIAGGAITLMGGVVAFGPTLAVCTSALLGWSLRLAVETEVMLQETADEISTAVSFTQCVSGSLTSCLEGVVNAAALEEGMAESRMTAQSQNINLAAGAVDTQGGDVKVTLSWNTTADIDLWVTDPAGEKIYYRNTQGLSGGKLDRDDVNGYGPENIYWPSGAAPTGTYLVQVNAYDMMLSETPTQFTILVQAFGRIQTYRGMLTVDEQVIRVVSFTRTSLPPQSGPLARVATTVHVPK